MSGVMTNVGINDGMSNVLKNMLANMNLLTSSFQRMQSIASQGLPTNTWNSTTESINLANKALVNYQNNLKALNNSRITTPNAGNIGAVQASPSINSSNNWNNLQGISTINSFGSERLQREMNDYKNMVTGISNLQDKLKTNIGSMDRSLLPQSAISDIAHAENRVNSLIQSMQRMSRADMSLLNNSQIESMNSSFESMRQNASSLINTISGINSNLPTDNLNTINSGFQQLNTLASQAEQQIRNASQALNSINSTRNWNGINPFEVMQGSGRARLQSEIDSYKNHIAQLNNMQSTLNIGSSPIRSLLPPNAISDIEQAQNRLNSLMTLMQGLSSINMSVLNSSQIESTSNVFEGLRRHATELQTTISSIGNNLNTNNVDALNSSFQRLNALTEQAETQIRNTGQVLNAINAFQWQGNSNMQIFNNSGFARARQEIQSANTMSNQLIQTQQRLTEESAKMRLISPQGINDINNLNSRIINIQNTIRNLEKEKRLISRWDTAGINQYNSRIERMRSSLHEITQVQQQWNTAVNNNNIQQVNNSYTRLQRIIDSIDSDVRDNTTAQNQFNNSLANGNSHIGKLKNGIKSVISNITAMAGAYGAVRMAQAGIKASDNYTNKKARLGLLTNNDAELKALQNETFKSAMNSRGNFNDSINSVAKLGLLAKEAFSGNSEVVQFSELMNKSFAISGASIQEQTAGMYQLVQAMAAGKLQGDEFRSIMENAPLLAQSIAQYTGKTKGQLKDMSREGQITSQIIKNALFNSADEINAKFAKIPNTFGSMLNQVKSTATMIFSPVMEQFNTALNQIDTNTLVSKITPGMNFAAMKLSQFGSYFAEIAANAAPNMNILTGGFSEVGRYILSANGLAGTFMDTLNTMVSNNSLAGFINSIAGGFKFFVQSIENVIKGIGWLSENFAGFFPIVGGVVTSFMTFNMVNGILNGGLKGVNSIIGSVSRTMSVLTAITNHQSLASQTQALSSNAQSAANIGLTASTAAQAAITNTSTISTIAQSSANNTQATSANAAALAATSNTAALTAQASAANSANIAQSGLNAALTANPFGLVANAAIKVISVMASLVSAIKAVNAAANMASDQANVGGYSDEIWLRHQKTGESLQYIQERKDEYANHRDFMDKTDIAIKAKNKELGRIQDSLKNEATIPLDYDTVMAQNKHLNQVKADLKKLEDQKQNRTTAYKLRTQYLEEQESQTRNLKKQMDELDYSKDLKDLKGLGGDIGGLGGNIDKVGNVGSVDKINNTVDITSEDLRYLKEFANDRAIVYATLEAKAPQITVHIAEVKETADVSKIIDEITSRTQEELLTSCEGVYIT